MGAVVTSYDAGLADFLARLDAELSRSEHSFEVEARPPAGASPATQLWITWPDGPPICVFWLQSETLMVLVAEYTFDDVRADLVPSFVAMVGRERISVRVGGWRRRAYLTVEVGGFRLTTDRIFRNDLDPWEFRVLSNKRSGK